MKFGPVPIADAEGAICVHSVRAGMVVLKKGAVVTAANIADLRAAGIADIVVAQLEEGDVSEDIAAAQIARAVSGEGVSVDRAATGRANLFATEGGVLVIDREAVSRLNRVDEAITFATLANYKQVTAGEMLATVKIIPFGIAGRIKDAAIEAVRNNTVLRVAPYRIKRVGVVSTLLPGLQAKVVEKTLKVTAERLAACGAAIVAERRVPHDGSALSAAFAEVLAEGAELVIVFGASAISDRRDVVPAAIEQAGGRIEAFGMPVDPGNLLLVGQIGETPVIGAPGCARSPKENGFDWVLARVLAGLPVTRDDIAELGVGGLLMEIVSRPQPRVPIGEEGVHRVAAIVLAAGKSRRMGGPNKMLATFDGKPLVRIVVEQALASRAASVIVVTGHQNDEVRRALDGLAVTFAHNPDFAEGLGTSVRTGIHAVPEDADGAAICLGDMPEVDASLIDALIGAFAPDHGALIVAPVHDGRRGNPVVWSRRFFPELMQLSGDIGARHLIERHAEAVAEVAVEGHAAFLDIDTPEALETARGKAGT